MAGKIPPEAFDAYLSLGTSRSYEEVAKRLGVSKRAIVAKAKAERWQQRITEIERQARANSDRKAVESLEQVADRHLMLMKLVQSKALQALRTLPIGTAMEAVRALDLAVRQERTIRGEPSERTALSLEEIVRLEHERWTSINDDDEA